MGARKKVQVTRTKAAKPLLSQGKVKKGKYYLQSEPKTSALDTEDGPLFMMKKKRKTSLLWYDVVIMLLEFLQILALIQTMSLRWVWPKTWLGATYFLFLFNLDVWEFLKVQSGAIYGVQNYYTPSPEIPVSYNYVLLTWALLLTFLTTAFVVTYVVLKYRKTSYFLIHVARMERAVLIIAQVFAIPIGVTIAKLFQCTDLYEKVDPLNEVTCFTDIHWAYIVISALVLLFLFVAVPGWMIYRTRQELIAMNSKHHETYLQLKEMEYMSGLDVIWMVRGFHIFSSFKLTSAYFRPVLHLFKLCLLVVYAAGAQHIFAQATAATGVIGLLLLVIIILRPYRILSFNIMLIFGHLCLLGGCIIGSCLASTTPSEVISPWLVEPYSMYTLVGINCFLVFGMIVFLIHLIVYNCFCRKRKGLSPIWPNMANQGANKIGEETKIYMVAVLKARAVIDRCRTVHPIFSPVHDLSHQIEIVNAYLREAEYLEDGLHDTLWDLLDEMIQLHGQLAPKSLFGDKVKDSIRRTAEELMKMMPMFSRRLAQRDYDLILVPPYKRRMLLKMLAMGFFLNGRSERVAKKQITGPEMKMMWPESEHNPKVEDKVEYYEDLVPPPRQGPDQEQMYLAESLPMPMELVDLEEDEQSFSSILNGAPQLQLQLFSPPPSRPGSSASHRSLTGVDNPGYEEDQPGTSGGASSELKGGSPLPGMVVDLEGHSEGETNVDDLPVIPPTKEDTDDHRETSDSQLQPVSSGSVPATTKANQNSQVRQKKLKKRRSTKRMSQSEDTQDSTDH